ncbi:MAG: phosphatase PAP2 family protein [Clostridia bacterium]|nr:phosphatase PAP2 family protein [Clostridia bacterium]
MEFLKWLEPLRTPALDPVISLITLMGDETFFTVLGLIMLWCVSKRWGFRFLVTGLTGSVMNQLLKAIFLIPRPWVLDESFTIVESAREGASGYSFPSGHTQSAATALGMAAAWAKRRWVTAACVIGVLLVAFSRMYLGVHTPLDVGVSLITGLGTVLGFNRLFDRYESSAKGRGMISLGCMAFALVLMGYVLFMPKGPRNVAEFDAHGVESAWKLTGTLAGILLAWWADSRFIHFETKALWWAQLLKLGIGLVLVLAVQSGLKPVFSSLFNGAAFAHGLRYLCMGVVGGILWPMTFGFWSRLK